jgi:hypothetical protein
MTLRHLAPLLLIALAPSIPRSIGACSLAPRDGGGWYEEPIVGDTSGPTQLVASYSVYRAPEDSGASLSCAASCGPGPSYVLLQLTALDDRTTAENLGYKFAIVGGQPPKNFQYDQILRVDAYGPTGNEIGLAFDRDSAPFSFDLEITAIDQNGNESTPIVIEIDG